MEEKGSICPDPLIYRNEELDQGDSWVPDELEGALIPTKSPICRKSQIPSSTSKFRIESLHHSFPETSGTTRSVGVQNPEAEWLYLPIGTSVVDMRTGKDRSYGHELGIPQSRFTTRTS